MTLPQLNIQRGAKVRVEAPRLSVIGADLLGGAVTVPVGPGRKLITFTYERDGKRYVCKDMPEDAPTKACDEGRHLDCNHRAGTRCEGGVQLKGGPDYFIWRCGCACHTDPNRAGLLF